jgi:hypothetical protein
MRFNFSHVLAAIDGGEVKMVSDDDHGSTLGDVCKHALLTSWESQRPPGPEEKYERYKLARKLDEGGILDIENNERDLIRKCVGYTFMPEALGLVWDLLDRPLPEVIDGGQAS